MGQPMSGVSSWSMARSMRHKDEMANKRIDRKTALRVLRFAVGGIQGGVGGFAESASQGGQGGNAQPGAGMAGIPRDDGLERLHRGVELALVEHRLGALPELVDLAGHARQASTHPRGAPCRVPCGLQRNRGSG